MTIPAEQAEGRRNNATAASPVVAVVGGVMIDWIFETCKQGKPTTTLPLAKLPGGKGANIALSTYRASHRKSSSDRQESKTSTPKTKFPQSDIRVFLNSAVGADSDGDALRTALEVDGLNCDGVLVAEGETGRVKVTVDVETKVSRGTVMSGTTRATFTPRDPSRIETLTGTTGEKPDLLIVGLEVPTVVIEPLLQVAAEAGVETILNPSPVRPLQDTTLGYVTHLVLNEVEAAKMVRMNAEEVKGNGEKRYSCAERFVGMGVKNVVLTLGDKGVFYLTARGESGLVPAVKGVVVVDTTGAG
jgi:ribokinase